MDSDGLPIVGTGVDYTKIDPIDHKELLVFVNHFVTHTVRFLNKFSCVCEEKLIDLSGRIQQLEITMNLLEAKLSSVPGLEGVTAAEYVPPDAVAKAGESVAAPTAPAAPAAPAAPPPPAAPGAPPPPPPPGAPEEASGGGEAAASSAPVMTVSKDPRYKKYFGMIRVGVPAVALRPKMIADGLDPDLLETPDAPVPDGAVPLGGGGDRSDSSEDYDDNDDDDDDDDDDDNDDFDD
ncbi:WASH complex subunit 3-like [Oscarella lobularis]|uniref:WASH complex subunit 3-like n=1 Tax=Oscarella lobularis TaxID=121494 RepID=UPI0033143EBE